MNQRALRVYMSLLLVPSLAAAQAPESARPATSPGDELLLKDFRPQSMLRVKEHPVVRARFPVIDFHGHLSRAEPDQMIRVMDACNVRMIVDFDGGAGDRFERQKGRFDKHPGRFVHFARLQWSRIDDADFSAKATRQLEEEEGAPPPRRRFFGFFLELLYFRHRYNYTPPRKRVCRMRTGASVPPPPPRTPAGCH